MTIEADAYCRDPFLTSYGGNLITQRLTERYGRKYTDYRAFWDRADNYEAPDFPLNLELDLISACNLKCRQCLRADDLVGDYKEYLINKKKLSLDQVVTVMDECRANGLPSVNIGGSGEPMLHPQFLEICAAIMERDVMELRIISNGTCLSEDVAKTLIDLQAHMLSVSIDAQTEETYHNIRGRREMFDKVVENVKRFLRLREEAKSVFPLLRVTFVRQPLNDFETEAFIAYWHGLADLVDIQVYCDYRSTDYRTDFSCTQPWKRLIVYPDLEVGPCCGFPGIGIRVGDLKSDNLLSIWNGSKLASFRELVKNRRYPLECLKCQGTRIDIC